MQSWMIALSLGIASVSFFPELPSLWLAFSLLLSVVLMLRRFHNPIIIFISFYTVGAVYAVCWGQHLVISILPESLEGQPLSVTGVIVGLPYRYQQHGRFVQRFELKISNVDCVQLPSCQEQLNKLRLKYYGSEELLPGQRWTLELKLKRPYGVSNPQGFDYQGWLIQRGVSAVGYVRPEAQADYLGVQAWQVDNLRWKFKHWLQSVQPKLEHKGLLAALLWAERTGVSKDQWQLFADTGTTHLMIISGLHVGLVAGFGFWLTRWLLIVFRYTYPERGAALTAIVTAFIYAAMAGFSLPTQRALIMVLVFMLSIILRRQLAVGQGLLLALLGCLVIDPLAPASASFWLSFMAVGVILIVCCGRFPSVQRWRQAVTVQFAVFSGLMPVLAVWIGQLSLIAPLCNLFTVPVFGFVLIPGLFIAVLSSALQWPFSAFLWHCLDGLLGFMLAALTNINQYFSSSAVPAINTTVVVIILSLAGILLLLAPKGFPLRVLGVVLVSPLFFSQKKHLSAGDFQMTVMDVGQGLSVLVETSEHQLLYDLGPVFSKDLSAVSTVILPTLRAKGINSLQRLVISHSDSDHSGDWSLLAEQVQVERLETGAREFFPSELMPHACVAGQQWHWDGVQFRYLYPFSDTEKELDRNNNNSCVLQIEVAGYRFLLTGDIERSVELGLLKRYGNELSSSVIIVPHHGSLTSSSWPFVKTVKPEHVVYTVGYRNRFGHPKEAVVERYLQQNAVIHRTDQHGATIFRVESGILQAVTHFREQRKRYWQ
jgi:competence protein ComEC